MHGRRAELPVRRVDQDVHEPPGLHRLGAERRVRTDVHEHLLFGADDVRRRGARDVCTMGSNGCWSYGSPVACGSAKLCTGSAGSSQCTCNADPVCTTAGNLCTSSTSSAVCSTDANGCVYESSSAGCGTHQSCTSGTCSCSSGYTSCSGTCTNVSTDLQNCGSCGHACATLGSSSEASLTCAADVYNGMCSGKPCCIVTLGTTQSGSGTLTPDNGIINVYAMPITVTNTLNVSELWVDMATSGGDVYFGIYSDSGGKPAGLLASSSQLPNAGLNGQISQERAYLPDLTGWPSRRTSTASR